MCTPKTHLVSTQPDVLPKYASARRFLSPLAPGTFLTGLGTGFFNTLLRLSGLEVEELDDVSGRHLVCLLFRDAGEVPLQDVL